MSNLTCDQSTGAECDKNAGCDYQLLDKYHERPSAVLFGPFYTPNLATRLPHVRTARTLLEARVQEQGALAFSGVVKLGTHDYCQVWTLPSEQICRKILQKRFRLPQSPCKHIGDWCVIRRLLPCAPLASPGHKLNDCVTYDRLDHAPILLSNISVAIWSGVLTTLFTEAIAASELTILHSDKTYYDKPITHHCQLTGGPALILVKESARLGRSDHGTLGATSWCKALVEILSHPTSYRTFLPIYLSHVRAFAGDEAHARALEELTPLHENRDARRRVISKAMMGAAVTTSAHTKRPLNYVSDFQLVLPISSGRWEVAHGKESHLLEQGDMLFLGGKVFQYGPMAKLLHAKGPEAEAGLLTLMFSPLTTSEGPPLLPLPTVSHTRAVVVRPRLRTFCTPRTHDLQLNSDMADMEVEESQEAKSEEASDEDKEEAEEVQAANALANVDWATLEDQISKIYEGRGHRRPGRLSNGVDDKGATVLRIPNNRAHHSSDAQKYVTSGLRLLALTGQAEVKYVTYRVVFQRAEIGGLYEPHLVITCHPRHPEVGMGLFALRHITAGSFIIPTWARDRVSKDEVSTEEEDNAIQSNDRTWWEHALGRFVDKDPRVADYLVFHPRPRATACFSPSFEYVNHFEGIASRPNSATDPHGGLYALTPIHERDELLINYWPDKGVHVVPMEMDEGVGDKPEDAGSTHQESAMDAEEDEDELCQLEDPVAPGNQIEYEFAL